MKTQTVRFIKEHPAFAHSANEIAVLTEADAEKAVKCGCAVPEKEGPKTPEGRAEKPRKATV